MLSLSGADGQGLQYPGVHPPDQGDSSGHDLLPLVLSVLPDHLPGLLPGLQTLVAPDVLTIRNDHEPRE